jgi:hypothetical protein
MPLLRIQRYKLASSPIYDTYAQELSTFALSGYVEFEFGTITGGSVPWSAGTWAFLTYATADASVTQPNLDLWSSVVPPTGFTAGAPQLDTVNQRVLITLTAI